MIRHPSQLWWFWLKVRSIPRDIRFWWTHRHETPEEYEKRIAETKKQFREIYNKHRRSWESLPGTREVQETIEFWDEMTDEVLGPEE